MDEEGLRIDLAEAIGKASAAICLQDALISMLTVKGLLTNADAATLAGIASQTLAAMPGLPEDAREMGKAALRGFAKPRTKRVTKN